jgi:hypothetical protein
MIDIVPLADGTGLEIHDRIEDVRFELYTDTPVEPTRVSTDPFRFPVTTAVEIDATTLDVPLSWDVHVRDDAGDVVETTVEGGRAETDHGLYEIEIMNTPVKLYARTRAAVRVESTDRWRRLSLRDADGVTLGIRSRHKQPGATIRVPDDPTAVARAVSTFGSALKSTSPERSYPSLRGHPPLVERADSLSIPAELDTPETDVRIEVPPRLSAVYRVTPLAYYLGATVEIESEPTLIAGSTDLSLSPAGLDFETRVNRVLQQQLFCDCLVRTEGLYPEELHERTAVESSVGLDFASLYDAPLADRIVAYDAVPFDLVEPHLPTWPLTVDVEPSPTHRSSLPFLARSLALVRTPEKRTPADVSSSGEVAGFLRSGSNESGEADEPPVAGGVNAVPRRSAGPVAPGDELFDPEPADSISQAWLGEGYPLGAIKPNVAAAKRRFTETVNEAGEITVRVVCNDREMSTEITEELYGFRDLVEFEVTVHRELSVAELRQLLEDDADFFHYVGHIDETGFACADGSLDARTLDDTGVKAFLLNACASYRQGEALVEAGARGGIVTLSTVFNEQAMELGRAAARMLNRGYPLDATLAILDEGPLASHRYGVVGDRRVRVCQSENGTPTFLNVTTVADRYEIEFYNYPTTQFDVGSTATPWIAQDGSYYLTGGRLDTYRITGEKLDEFVHRTGEFPALVDGEFRWFTAKSR